MKIAWTNRADAALTLTSDSEIATLPAANVQNAHVAKKWYTVAGVTAAYLIFDLGSSLACEILAILGTNLTAAGTVRVRASDADPTVVGALLLDTTALACGSKAGYGAIYKAFTSTPARYWRIDLSDAAVAEAQLRVGRVFLGPAWTPSVPQMYEWAIATADPSPGDESYAGQEWDCEKPQRRALMFTLCWMDAAEMVGNAFAMERANGRVRDVLAIPDITGTYLSEQAVFGKLKTGEPLPQKYAQVYYQKFTITERL